MREIKTAIWGFGAMGQGIAEMISKKRGMIVSSVCDLNPELVGKNISDILDITTDYDVYVTDDIDSILAREHDVLFIATDSFTADSFPKIKKVIQAGINVISTAEEMAFPSANEPELAEKINLLAKENDVTVLGTGINPGFVMDLLAVMMSAPMVDVKKIEARRVNSLSPFGKTVMEEQGVGITEEEFDQKTKNNELAGHVGFKESMYMIAEALGVQIIKFEQQMKPIITNVDRQSKYGEAKKGTLAGINMTAQAFIDDESVFIDMKHPQQIEPEDEGTYTGDYIKIHGSPEVNLSVKPEIEGGLGTIAMCVNSVPNVLNATAGLKTMIDLPVPRAIVGDARNLLK